MSQKGPRKKDAAIDALERMLDDANEAVRKAAEESLQKLRHGD